MDSRRIERIAAGWLARRGSEYWSDADRAEFDAWLAESTAHRVAWLRLNAAWQRSDRLKSLGAGMPAGQIPERGQWTLSPFFNASATEETVAGRQAKSSPSQRQGEGRKWMRIAGVAAGGVLSVATALVWQQYRAEESARYNSRLGGVQEVTLTDGSQATLGSNSYMEVTASRRQRQVDLERGEVYFDVVRDPARTFVVEAGGRRIVAVGTRFAVRHDPGELRVVVTEGTVRLESTARAAGPPTLLTGGMVARVSGGEVQIQEYSVERAEELLSWRDGFLVFRDTPLSEAVAEFNRYSARKLVIVDAAIADIPIGGNFRWSNTDAFVRLLEQGFGVRSEQRGNEIVLSGLPATP